MVVNFIGEIRQDKDDEFNHLLKIKKNHFYVILMK
jgi:hypothetical protein